jgi:hypothetical protein
MVRANASDASDASCAAFGVSNASERGRNASENASDAGLWLLIGKTGGSFQVARWERHWRQPEGLGRART